jgi:hypothetical protein
MAANTNRNRRTKRIGQFNGLIALPLVVNDAHSGVYQSFLDRFRARGELANRYVERPINYVFGWPFAGGIPLRKTQALTSQNIREMIIINDDFQTFV